MLLNWYNQIVMQRPPIINHQLTIHTKLLHKVAIVRENLGHKEVLILKRSSDALSRPNCWDLPGGNSEWPSEEQPSAANLHQADIVREVIEETNLEVAAKLFDLSRLVSFSTYYDHDKQVYTVICAWTIDFSETNQGEIKISSEHQDLAWVRANDLDSYDFGVLKGVLRETISTALKK